MFTLPLSNYPRQVSYPLTWYNDENISVQPPPSGVWTWEAVSGVLVGRSQWKVGMILGMQKPSVFLAGISRKYSGDTRKGSEEETLRFYQYHHSFGSTTDSPSIFYKLLCKHSLKSKFLANSLPSLPKKMLYLSPSYREILEPPLLI